MAFENVFGNVDYGQISRARQSEADRLQQAIGLGIAQGQRAQEIDIKNRQLAAKEGKLDLGQEVDMALVKRFVSQGIPPEQAYMMAFDAKQAAKATVDPYGNVRAGVPLQQGMGLPSPQQNMIAQQGPVSDFPGAMPIDRAVLDAPAPAGARPAPAPPVSPAQQSLIPGSALPDIPVYSDTFEAPEVMGAYGEKQELGFDKALAEKQAGSNIAMNEYLGKKDIDNVYAGMELNKSQANARSEYEATVGQLIDAYEQLIEAGAAKETLGDNYTINDVMRNLKITVAASPAGQLVTGAIRTQGKAALDLINSVRPLMFGKLRVAMGLTGRELDTKPERDFYLQAISSPETDMETNFKIMRNLSARYGDGSNVERIDAMISKLSSKKELKGTLQGMTQEERMKDYKSLLSRGGP